MNPHYDFSKAERGKFYQPDAVFHFHVYLESDTGGHVPLIAQFRGISIYMDTERDAPHHLPHFHAYYGEYLASFTLTPPGLLEGALPRAQLRIVLAWAELHQSAIEENWRRVQTGLPPQRIPGI